MFYNSSVPWTPAVCLPPEMLSPWMHPTLRPKRRRKPSRITCWRNFPRSLTLCPGWMPSKPVATAAWASALPGLAGNGNKHTFGYWLSGPMLKGACWTLRGRWTMPRSLSMLSMVCVWSWNPWLTDPKGPLAFQPSGALMKHPLAHWCIFVPFNDISCMGSETQPKTTHPTISHTIQILGRRMKCLLWCERQCDRFSVANAWGKLISSV